MASPSPYPYPSLSPSSQPFSFTPTPGSLASASVASASLASASVASASPQVYLSYVPMPSYSASPIGLPISASNILSHVSDDALYGIICAIVFLVLYSSIYAIYYYKKYKKEKFRFKRLNELQRKVSVLNSAYPE